LRAAGAAVNVRTLGLIQESAFDWGAVELLNAGAVGQGASSLIVAAGSVSEQAYKPEHW
jgi:hypothetical protein